MIASSVGVVAFTISENNHTDEFLVAARDLPAGREFAATLLILREFMHHLGFIEVSLLAAQP